VWDEKTSASEIRLLANHLELAATTIGAIYKERWQIELFFKTLKQNLKIKTFAGTSPNAVHTQIWTALIAILLVRLRDKNNQVEYLG
jgi:IS4 transposase